MGVPKFYRWISERYPCLSQVVQENQIPDFDNLYLDMNGIIHQCSHPDDGDAHFRITETQIFSGIFHYIEALFRMIKPQKVFFMAVDGVAPRAKMNQQRARRFRAAKEAEMLEQKAKEKGEKLPEDARFDSNCITPGTEFMARLQTCLEYFVVKKISTDKLWQGVTVYLSGHLVPGEGEHKIMEFIRHQKSRPEYNPNTRHCLYGLDADLIMLGMTSHEPHFSLLREEVKFGARKSQKRITSVEETTFNLLHLSLLRDYLDHEFSSLKESLPFPYDIEKIIDDWVLMGFLVGNDFIPHLPHLHIQHDALPIIWNAYKDVMPQLDGYINDGGALNLKRFQAFLQVLSKIDLEKFSEQHEDFKWLEGRKRQPRVASKPIGNQQTDTTAPSQTSENGTAQDPVSNEEASDLECSDVLNSDDEILNPEQMEGFRSLKREYYKEKMDYTMTPGMLADQAIGYVTGIQWILYYYYDGVPSWSWFYPHHYAPYLSDVRGFDTDKSITFDLGEPFLPYQQLMAVLPAASCTLLPECYWNLMTEKTSTLIEFYPTEFKTDLNGKQQDWEAVVLIPFIQEEKLLSAMMVYDSRLTSSERERNCRKSCRLYEFSATPHGAYQSPVPEAFSSISFNHTTAREVTREELSVPRDRLVKGLCSGVHLDVGFAGFPTLKLIRRTAYLNKAQVRVFQATSRNESMILRLLRDDREVDKSVAFEILQRETLWVGWPHLLEARVTAVVSDVVKFTARKFGETVSCADDVVEETLNAENEEQWISEEKAIRERYRTRFGIEVGITSALVFAKPFCGERYSFLDNGKVVPEKQWAAEPQAFLLQTSVADSVMRRVPTTKACNTFAEIFAVGSRVFGLGPDSYGCFGEVTQSLVSDGKRVEVSFTRYANSEEAALTKLRQQKLKDLKPGTIPAGYFDAGRAAQLVGGISAQLLSRITGTVFVQSASSSGSDKESRINIGLDLKRNMTGTECPGYTIKKEDVWYYSDKLISIVQCYVAKFPHLFERLMKKLKDDNFLASDIFDAQCCSLKEVLKYVRALPTNNIQRLPHGSAVLDSETVLSIEQLVDEMRPKAAASIKKVKIRVLPSQLYCDSISSHTKAAPDPDATFELFDRVIHVWQGYTVPLGLRGTIIGIVQQQPPDLCQENAEPQQLYEIVFDEPFSGGMAIRSSADRAYRVRPEALINLTYGLRKTSIKDSKKRHGDSGTSKAVTAAAVGRPSSATAGAVASSASSTARGTPPVRHEDLWNNMAGQSVTSSRSAKGRDNGSDSSAAAQSLRPGAGVVKAPGVSPAAPAANAGRQPARDESARLKPVSSASSANTNGSKNAVSSRLIVSSKFRQQQQQLTQQQPAAAAHRVQHPPPPLPPPAAHATNEASDFMNMLKALEQLTLPAGAGVAEAAQPQQQQTGVQSTAGSGGLLNKKITVKELFDSVASSQACDSVPATGSTAFSGTLPTTDCTNILVSSSLRELMVEPSVTRSSVPLDRQQHPTTAKPMPYDASADLLPCHLDSSGVQAVPPVIADATRAHGGTVTADGGKQSSSRASARDASGSIDVSTPPPGTSNAQPPSVPPQPAAGEPLVSKPPVFAVPTGGRTRELFDCMRFAGLPPPQVEWIQQSESKFVASITLTPGVRVHGTACDNREAAIESAAAVAMVHLSSHLASRPPMHYSLHSNPAVMFAAAQSQPPPPQHLPRHPLAAFQFSTPPYGAVGLPPPFMIHGGSPAVTPFAAAHNRAAGVYPSNMTWPMAPYPFSQFPSTRPHFIPMQVTRYQASASVSGDSQRDPALPTVVAAPDSLPDSSLSTRVHQLDSARVPSSSAPHQQQQHDTSAEGSRRSANRASRLAANFNRK